MASLLLTPLPGAATITLCSETLLQACQSQLPPALAATLALLAISRLPSSGPSLHGLTTASSSTCYLQWRCMPHYHANSRRYFSSTKSSQTSSGIPDCSATLMQYLYCRNELLARNSTGKLSAPAGAGQQHARAPYKLSEEISN